MILQFGIWIYLRDYNVLLTIANTLNIDEKLIAKNNPEGCIETDSGSSENRCDNNPFFSYPSASKKFHILTVLS